MNTPKVLDYKHCYKNKKKQKELMGNLIACKIAYLIAHPELNKKEDSESLDNLINMLRYLHKPGNYEPNKN